MPAVEAVHVTKSYADKPAVDDLSFSVAEGEVFGLIGPNGAGKTTTLRMVMDVIKPDSGEVTVLGKKLTEATKNRIGYLPEERGLYRKARVIDCMTYFATLKGMDRGSARRQAISLLDQTGMLPHRDKKVEELSKGMAQIIQFIVTIMHGPDLIVMDEPLSGLDPVNTELLKGMLVSLREKGKAIILSTHGMNDVEELCDRVLMVDHGRSVLYGGLADIKSRYRMHSVLLEHQGELGVLAGVSEVRQNRGCTELVLDRDTTPQQVLQQLVIQGTEVRRFEVATPSLNEIFLMVVGKDHE
jgi:ABC-2 type transport system ATP-binding protein